MHTRIIPAIFLIFLLILPAWAQETIDSSSGRVEVDPEIEENVISVPVDEESGMVNWQDYLSLPAGGGASWAFITSLYPPDPVALADCPEILLDGAWYPPIPFAFGYAPPSDYSTTTKGWWYLDDGSGNLARRDMDIIAGSNQWVASTWFMGSGWAFHIEQNWSEGYFGEGNYLPDEWTGPGIDYFLRSIWFRGILTGDRMQQLLMLCNAQRIGQDMINGGRDRLVIYQIPANEIDRQNGRGSLLVWVTIGEWRIIRTRLHATYAIEVTEFRNISADVTNDPQVFYSDFLPPDVYWSIDQYLLTRDSDVPFFEFSDFSFTGGATAPIGNIESGTIEFEYSEESETVEDVEDVEESDEEDETPESSEDEE